MQFSVILARYKLFTGSNIFPLHIICEPKAHHLTHAAHGVPPIVTDSLQASRSVCHSAAEKSGGCVYRLYVKYFGTDSLSVMSLVSRPTSPCGSFPVAFPGS